MGRFIVSGARTGLVLSGMLATGLLGMGLLDRASWAQSQIAESTSSPSRSDVSSPLAGHVLLGAVSKSRSLQRTSELLSVPQQKTRVQLALVIDGTDSMGAEIESLKNQLGAVVKSLSVRGEKQPPRTVEVAIVVYRDDEAKSGAVTVPMAEFTSDIESVRSALSHIQIESGLPYFEEKVDLGIHTALSRLNWAPAEDAMTERWIVVCGDAPPYPEGASQRAHTTESLAQLAIDRNVHTCFVLCSSGFQTDDVSNQRLKETSLAVRPGLQEFAGLLAEATVGTQVDTAEIHHVNFWIDAQIEMAEVTEADISAAREQMSSSPRGAEIVKVAVLPHLPLSKMSFGKPDSEEVIAARQMTECLKRVTGFGVKTIDSIEAEFRRIVSNKDPEDLDTVMGQQRIMGDLAKALNVEFVIWGKWKRGHSGILMESRIYRDSDGQQMAEVAQETGTENPDGQRDLAAVVLRKLCRKTATDLRNSSSSTDPEVLALFERINSDDELAREVVTPLALDHRAQRNLLIGLDYLERSLQVAANSGEWTSEEAQTQAASVNQLNTAIQYLKTSLDYEPENPLTHLLLANCYYNLSAVDPSNTAISEKQKESLVKARAFSVQLQADHPVRLEVEATCALLVDKDFPKAIESYQKLLSDKSQRSGRFGLRAQWMLAGIYLGDWNVAAYSPQTMNVDLARARIIDIIAGWPESPEAKFYEACLHGIPVPAGRGLLAQSQ